MSSTAPKSAQRPRHVAVTDLRTAGDLRRAVRERAEPDRVEVLQRFFRTGPGEYGEGDRFLGVRVPQLRSLVRPARAVPLDEVLELLRSPWHEDRLLALLLMVDRHRRGEPAERQAIHAAYLANTGYVNNWDLVDSSAEQLVGAHLAADDRGLLKRLARSPSVWQRRIAMIATFHWTRRGEPGPALEVARWLLEDDHDLIHKAVGWMLREVGKRDLAAEEAFLREHLPRMPRTMLRYAIERFPEAKRRAYLQAGRATRLDSHGGS